MIVPYIYSSSVMYQLARLLLLSVSSVVTFSHQQPEVPTDFLIRFVETFNMDYIIIIRNGSGLSWFKVLKLFYIFCFGMKPTKQKRLTGELKSKQPKLCVMQE